MQKREMTASRVLLTIVIICIICHALKTCLNITEFILSFQVLLDSYKELISMFFTTDSCVFLGTFSVAHCLDHPPLKTLF